MRASWFGVNVVAIVRAGAIVVAVIAAACGPREAGPDEREFGEVQFWEVTGDGEITFGPECTDAESFRGDITPPEFQPNSFLVFKLSDDGSTATAQDCERIDPDSCVDDELDIVFEVDVDSHTYTTALPTQIIPTGNPACDIEMAQTWTLEDLGETLTLDVDLPTTLVGDPAACAAAEEAIAAEGSNGQGIDGCVVNLHVETEFSASL
jgi:hypothetical protein